MGEARGDREATSFRFARTLDGLVEQARTGTFAGASVEAWLFEDREARRAGEMALAACGLEARLRSAYKPLVHAFLEEIDVPPGATVAIGFPVHSAASPSRFQLEAYPLAGLLECPVTFTAREDDVLAYAVTVTVGDTVRRWSVAAPNHVHGDAAGTAVLSPTGWLRVVRDGATVVDERLETDVEALHARAVAALKARSFGAGPPLPEDLVLDVTLPFADRRLSVGDEAISLAEALHEDLYFSAIEVAALAVGRPAGDRTLRPGRVVPVVAVRPEAPSLAIRSAADAGSAIVGDAATVPDGALSAPEIAARLEAIGGVALAGTSVRGRAVVGRWREGTDAPVLISAGQHANEATGVAGALDAAAILAAREGAHFAILPLENPDGYALSAALAKVNPAHMHHAARYTALGDDLEYREGTDVFERSARDAIASRIAPGLHVNLHGYPAHEWTRPFSGYLPRGFEDWTMPRGFFLIMEHAPHLQSEALRLAASIAESVAAVPGLVELNEAQERLAAAHGADRTETKVAGIAIRFVEKIRAGAPLHLITEYPDETVYGAAFRLGRAVQCATVIAAYEAWQEIRRSIPTA